MGSSNREVSHYVVTAHPPGGVLFAVKCNFLAPDSEDVVIAKSRRLEVRQLSIACSSNEDSVEPSTSPADNIANTTTPFPIILSVPINGRITAMEALQVPSSRTSYLFLATDQLQYAVVGYSPHESPYPLSTHACGSLRGDEWNVLGRPAECGPLVSVDPHYRCVALHLYDGLLTIFPIQQSYIPPQETAAGAGRKSSGSVKGGSSSSMVRSSSSVLAQPFHARMEERTILSLTMLHHLDANMSPPHVCLLHQDSRGAQHITTHAIDLQKHQVWFLGQTPGSMGGPPGGGSGASSGVGGPPPTSTQCEWLKKSRIDGGSSLLIPVPPRARAATAAGAAATASAASTPQYPGAGYSNPSSMSPANHSGGVVILGQRQITYCALNHYKVMPIPPALLLSWDHLPPDVTGNPRYLIGDEFGNLHMLTLITSDKMNKVIALQLDTLGSCTLSSQLVYLNHGLVFCGSTLGDSQLIQIHDEPIPVDQDEADDSLELGDTTYLSVVEEYTHLGPIVDFDLVPTTPGNAHHPVTADGGVVVDPTAGEPSSSAAATGAAATNPSTTGSGRNQQQHQPYSVVQSQVVTASGSSKSGTVRVVRNGIGMKEYASVELGGIQNMWSLRQSFNDTHDAFLVQSFVGETRVLGVSSGDSSSRSGDDDQVVPAAGGKDGVIPMEQEDDGDAMKDQVMEEQEEAEEEVGGTLEEVVLPGLESNASTLYVSNVVGDLFLQITESQLRLASNTGELLDTWSPPREEEEEGVYTTSSIRSLITVASANEAGQIVIALRGGLIMYFHIRDQKLKQIHSKRMDREVSCMNLNPFTPSSMSQNNASLSSFTSPTDMDIDGVKGGGEGERHAPESRLVAVGLWDDFTVRLLSLEAHLAEVVQIHLSTNEDEDEDPSDAADAVQGQRRSRNNMMARSLCLITLDFHHSSSGNSGANKNNESSANLSTSGNNSSPGVNMLFVGLGDGTLVSFAVGQPDDGRQVTVRSKKEVSLGTQRINLVPLHTEGGGTCVLATGDRPTVIYLAGVGGSSASSSTSSNDQSFNPKLCYSNVNLSAAPEDDPDSNVGAGMSPAANDVSRPHTQQSIAVNVASPFNSPLLFDALGHTEQQQYSLCVADDVNLRLGVIDDIQKLHVTTCRLGMAPRRIVHCPEGRLFAVGCIESGIKQVGLGGGEMNMGNLIRFLDDTTLDDIDRIHLEPCEMVLSMVSATLRVFKPSSATTDGTAAATPNTVDTAGSPIDCRQYLVIGTAYALHDEDEPTKGRIIVLACNANSEGDETQGAAVSSTSRAARIVTELQVRGGVYSMCQFYEGKLLVTVNSKTQVCQMVNDGTGVVKLSMYYPQHETLEEVARDFNANWTTAVEMLTNDVYLGGESWNNLFVLRRNTKAQSEEVRCRLDTVGEFHLGEMVNKFMSGSLVMPQTTTASLAASNNIGPNGSRRRPLASPKKSSSGSASNADGGGGKPPASPGGSNAASASASGRSQRPVVAIGSQTLFGTVDGTLGVILGLDGPTAAFFASLERSLDRVVKPVGNFSHKQFRAFDAEQRVHPRHGFVDGDLVESFLDLDRSTMELVVEQMNRDGGWEIEDAAWINTVGGNEKESAGGGGSAEAAGDDARVELVVEDVLAVVEEMTMLH